MPQPSCSRQRRIGDGTCFNGLLVFCCVTENSIGPKGVLVAAMRQISGWIEKLGTLEYASSVLLKTAFNLSILPVSQIGTRKSWGSTRRS